MNISYPGPGRRTSLLLRLSLPIFALIVTFVALFAALASYILIRVQNEHTHQIAEQSMKFVYRNIAYQFDTMNNVAAFLLTNQSIENLLESEHQEPYEAVGDFFALQTNLQNLSLLSLLSDVDSRSAVQQSYAVSVALEPGSGLYPLATDHFDPVTGIYKSLDLQNEPWFQVLNRGERQAVWWGQKIGRSNAAMIYSATKKTSIKDGRTIGTVIVGADIGSIRSVFSNAALEKGYHLLLDGSGRVIFSERYDFLEEAGALDYVRNLSGESGSVTERIGGEPHRVMYETMDNGWRLLTVVPESHFNRYAFFISSIGALTAAATLLIAGFWLRRIVVRVTVPITRLVSAIQRPEVLEFKEPLPPQNSGIYEVDALNEKFSAMLVTLHGLIEKSFTEEMERRQLQLELLQAQINPHFLYNTLDLINCRAILAGDAETSRIVRALANVFRYGLNQGQAWITLDSELKQVEAYLQIQRLMMEDLAVDVRVPADLLSATLIHFCLQPLAENAIIHGFAGRAKGNRLTLSARLDGSFLVLSVADNGSGCQVEERNRSLQEPFVSDSDAVESLGDGTLDGIRRGYGTLNVHRRIRLHCGEAYGLRYVHKDEGTCVEAVLPFRPNLSFVKKGDSRHV